VPAAGRCRWIRYTGCSAALGGAALGLPREVYASVSSHEMTAQAAMGTLPLLAALGIGIAVAAAAVVAFLQMTAKSREAQESSDAHDIDDWETDEPAYGHGFGNEVADGPADEASLESERSFLDYTIPFTGVPAEFIHPDSHDESGPRLYGVGGELSGASYVLGGKGLSIGRDPSQCDVVFPMDNGEVSRRHCTLRFEQISRLFVLEDHGSSNGTFLPDGERLQPGRTYTLRSGERFALSGARHWFEVRH
jgi:hypothetical protein